MQFRDIAGNEIGSKICTIIGSDGGIMPYARNHTMPPNGLMTDVAYRWDIVCDFSNYTQSVRLIVAFLSEKQLLSSKACFLLMLHDTIVH